MDPQATQCKDDPSEWAIIMARGTRCPLMPRLGLHATLHRPTATRGSSKNKWINDSPLRGGMSPCPPPSIYRHACLVLSCPSHPHFFWQRFPSISSSSSEMLFVVAFINQHSADAAAPFSPSFFLFHQRSRLSDSRLPSGLATQGAMEGQVYLRDAMEFYWENIQNL